MGKTNVLQKVFWEDNARFADLFNVVLGNGKVIITAENLTKEETTVLEVVKKENQKIFVEKFRDVIKRATTDVTCFLIGIEHQDDINYAMPLRIMLWDALSYQEQIRELERMHKVEKDLKPGAEYLSGIKKTDRLKPICTIVLYSGESEWDGPINLHEMLEWTGIPEHLREWIGNYPMVLVDMFRFKDWEVFQTDLREVFGFMQNVDNKKSMELFLENNKERLAEMAEDACDLLEEITGTKDIRKFRDEQKGVKKDMCKAIDEMLQEKYEEGQRDMCKAIDEMLQEKYEEGQRDMRKAIDEMLQEKYEEGQRDMRKAIDEMLQEQFEERCKQEMELRQKAEMRIKYLEKELQKMRSIGESA